MKNIIRKMLILSVILSLTTGLFSLTISVYHTSDVHGWYYSRKAKWDKENKDRLIGGFAALSALVKKDKNPYILLDSGDMFQGTPEGNTTFGEASIKYMNALGYAAGVIGNHEYDFGEPNVKKLTKMAKFPFLSANIYYKKNNKRVEYVKPYRIIKVSGKKIAIIGLAGKHTSRSTLPSNVRHLKFLDEARTAKKVMKEVEKYNPDAVIIIAHIGINPKLSRKIVDVSTYTFEKENLNHTTIEVERAVKKANLILGGHNHTGLLKGWKDPKTNTMVCESYWGLTHVTKAELVFDDKTGKFVSANCKLIPLWVDETGEDPEILKITEKIKKETSKKMDIEIGEATETIGFDSDYFDTPIGNFLTDITREAAGAEIAFQNSGGIRYYLNKGKIKLRDVYQVMPFENTIVKVSMTGDEIYELIKDNLRPNRTSMQISGITVKYKFDKNGNLEKLIIEKDGKPLKKDKKYMVATNNYLTSGGSGGRVFKHIKYKRDTMIPVREAMINYIKKHKKVSPPKTGRFIPIE